MSGPQKKQQHTGRIPYIDQPTPDAIARWQQVTVTADDEFSPLNTHDLADTALRQPMIIYSHGMEAIFPLTMPAALSERSDSVTDGPAYIVDLQHTRFSADDMEALRLAPCLALRIHQCNNHPKMVALVICAIVSTHHASAIPPQRALHSSISSESYFVSG